LVCGVVFVVVAVIAVIFSARSTNEGQEQKVACEVFYRALERQYYDPYSRNDTETSLSNGGLLNDTLMDTVSIEADFGGVWVVGDRIKVGLVEASATSIESRETIIRISAEMGLVEWVDIVSVEFSRAELIGVRDAITELSSQHIGLGVGSLPIFSGLLTHLNRVSVNIPFGENDITDGHCRVLAEIEEFYWDRVLFMTYDSLPMIDPFLDR